MLIIYGLGACSILPGGGDGGEKRLVGEEEITVASIYISKGRAHCDDKSGKKLAETKADLEDEGIKVFSSACGIITGKMAPALCGAITLHVNVHKIDQRKFPEAQALGYEPVTSLEYELDYETESCE